MMKIIALNEVITHENEDELTNALTKEAQEQVALNEYNRALELLITNKKNEALNVLIELLNTDLLDKVNKPQVMDGRSRPMLSLKYSCFKNIASIQAELQNYHEALYNYWEAANLDDSDVVLWYRIGIMATKISNLDLACFAYKYGLKRNKNHWPSLDNIITVLYAIPDYMNCLLYISMALERDPTYIKGLAFRQKIFNDIKIYNSDWVQDPLFDTKYDKVEGNLLLNKATELKQKWMKSSKIEFSKPPIDMSLRRALSQYSWLELGKSLVDMHRCIIDNNLNFISHVTLNVSKWYEPKISDNTSTICTELYSTNKIPGQAICNNIESNSKFYKNEILIKENSVSPMDIMFNVKKLDSDINASQSSDFNNKQFENDELTVKDKKGKSQKVKKRRRSSLCFLTQWAWSNSNIKRSSRVRTSGRKEYERDGVLLEETFKRIFPSSLLPDNTTFTKKELLKNNDDSMDTIDLCTFIANKESTFVDETKNIECSKSAGPTNEDQLKYFGTEQENIDVNEFINKHTGQSNILTIIIKFLDFLCTKWNFEWPEELPELYIQSYFCMRKHIQYSSPFIENVDECMLKLDAEKTLLFCELYTDKWLSSKPCILSACSLNRLGIGILSEDLGYIMFCNTKNEMYNEKPIDFLLRSLWLKANIFLYQGDTEIALKTLELLLCHMQRIQTDVCKPFLKLANCKYNSTINIKNVQKMLTFIQRGKKFCKIKYLYHEKQYEELSYILKETFHFSKHTNNFLLCKEVPVDRVEHLKILLDTLWQLRQHEDCYVWAEACLHESWYNYLHTINSCANEDERNKWTRSVLFALEKLEACVIEVSTFIVRYLSESRRTRLVQNLVHIVCHQLDVLDNTPSMQIESVSPWIILHFILQHEEDKQRAKSVSTLKYKMHNSIHSDEEDDEDFPASVTILLKAHEFLGRHGWCCICEGKLLLFILKFIIPRLQFPLYATIKRKLKESVEQIIYCLYGHPSKFNTGSRSKPKYIEEHIKTTINLSWETCQLLFEFYKPDVLPSFESKRVDSINLDTVLLFKKICLHIPVDSDPTKIADEMSSYLLGTKDKLPSVKKSLPNHISYIYYLIADHYFKAASNQSWSSAAKYYIFDLCLHPRELNSWAGLAMSTSTLMETWLNNFQPNINEEKYLAKAKIAQRSYQHAIELVPSHLTIWTEFGNFLYTVHSFCSRLLKQESDSLNMKRFRILETKKEEMLDEAKDCFASANNIYTACQGMDEQDERWLYQYMLAKIAEKKNQDPPIFLKHYSKASDLLCENNAEYPKRINHKNPQNLSIEALEVYYRIHASILKYLDQHEGKPLKTSIATVLENNLKHCMQNPFMKYDSIFKSISKEGNNVINQTNITIRKQSFNVKDDELISYYAKPTIININKSDLRKRYNDELITISDVKKLKLSSMSHLQLMQDVVALIDDLITKVCDKVSPKESQKEQNPVSKSDLNDSFSSIVITSPKNSIIQYFMDNSLKEEIKLNEEKSILIIDDTDKNKCETKWFQNEDLHTGNSRKSEKLDDKKKNIKIERALSRRSSQESTTTTQTSTSETNNSTSSSSDDSSTTDDSSDTSSSTDSDSDSIDSNLDRKKKESVNEYTYLTEEDNIKLIEYCLSGLEQCILRFPEHYKSIYRLAYFFFYNKIFKNILKCKQLLLGTYECQFYKNQTIQGLFAERKNTNFFNGIWRIPINEIDRPGSFASHMSRCVVLLMQVLKETGDGRMLIELCIQLRKIPDPDKKYLRDSEREQLSGQALTLCLQCFRNKIKTMSIESTSMEHCNNRIEDQMQVLLDIYHVYQNIKNIQEYEVLEIPKVRKLLEDGYVLYIGNPNIHGNIFELAKECCRQKIRVNKTGPSLIDPNAHAQPFGDIILPSPITNSPASSNMSFVSNNRKSQKSPSISGRPRGRPPGIQKFPQLINSDSLLIKNEYSSNHSSTNTTYVSNTNTLSSNSYYINPFLEPNILAAMFGPSFNANIIDSAMNYFNQAGTYQDIIHRYQDNVNTIPHLKSSYNKKNSGNFSKMYVENHLPVTDSNLNIEKEKPDISITPVTNIIRRKPKSVKLAAHDTQHEVSDMSLQIPKSVKITPCSRLPLFKTTHNQHVSQLESDHQMSLIANSLSSGNSVSRNCITVPQSTHTTVPRFGINTSASQPGTSLQHKLLSKKHGQHPYQLVGIHKPKPTKNSLPSNHSNPIKSVSTPYKTTNSSIASFDPTTLHSTKCIKLHPCLEKSINTNVAEVPILTNSFKNTIKDSNTLSTLSQLQQHSHLEIIPQINHVKQDINAINNPRRSIEMENPCSTISLFSTESVSVYEMSKCKIHNTP
ncbi:PREDICTED: calcineurin-binding protein cabin-1-like, partial [Ceratosolen solmsi marchali]|uniref:Calcineurin-binding protein cabin-1-like n=1 Tax=Ceratosolen solmsi marchali TaxID=326594 RepID=A0AAJ6YQZ6_9HYME